MTTHKILRPMLLLGATALLWLPAAPAEARPEVAEIPVEFTVSNTNAITRCHADGKTYTIRGSLVGPRRKLRDTSRDAVTLYLHGSGDASTWHFPGVDHITEMAELGHVSVFIHMLGYGPSDPADGSTICWGSIVEMVHQVVHHLRAGTYRSGARKPPRFERVALAGHSAGGIEAELYSVTYSDIDAVVLAGWADAPPTYAPLYKGAAKFGAACAQGGRSKAPGGPDGWARVFSASGLEGMSQNLDPAVRREFVRRYEDDPCGIAGDTAETLASSIAKAPAVTSPVLLVYGDRDGFNNASYEVQRARYVSSDDVSLSIIANTGHMMMIGRTAPEFRATVSGWLNARGF